MREDKKPKNFVIAHWGKLTLASIQTVKAQTLQFRTADKVAEKKTQKQFHQKFAVSTLCGPILLLPTSEHVKASIFNTSLCPKCLDKLPFSTCVVMNLRERSNIQSP